MPTAPVSDLVDLMNEATDAYIKGETRHYFSLFGHPAECSLIPPYGGETRDNLRHDDEAMAETSAFFAAGAGHFDLQHGEVGGLPDQEWSLRVTLVFRRSGDGWELLHRHADPLVRPIPFEHCAELARGLDT